MRPTIVRLAAACEDNIVRLFDVATGTLAEQLPHAGPAPLPRGQDRQRRIRAVGDTRAGCSRYALATTPEIGRELFAIGAEFIQHALIAGHAAGDVALDGGQCSVDGVQLAVEVFQRAGLRCERDSHAGGGSVEQPSLILRYRINFGFIRERENIGREKD